VCKQECYPDDIETEMKEDKEAVKEDMKRATEAFFGSDEKE